MNSWEKPCFASECGLCGGSAGAFRKSTDGQWVHAFCAEVELFIILLVIYSVEECLLLVVPLLLLECI